MSVTAQNHTIPIKMRRLLSIATALLLLTCHLDAAGQLIPKKGTSTTFDLATWNIEWFGASNGPSDDELQIANALDVFRRSEIDLWALQEIADASDFSRILDSLGSPYAGFLATSAGCLFQSQKIGYLYNTDVVRLISQTHILPSFCGDFAQRLPLQMKAEITIGDSSKVITLITVHMKAFSDTQSYDKRLAASGRLKNHIDFTTLEDEPVILLGDFNDELTSSITPGKTSPYDNFLQDTDDYFFATLALEQDGRNSWCGSSSSCISGSTIDHILITNEMLPFLVGNSPDHYIELIDSISSYTNTTSDHLPIISRFDLSRPSSIEKPIYALDSSVDVYPNPFASSFHISWKEPTAGSVTISVFNVVGQLVYEADLASLDNANIDLSAQTSGVYMIRIQTDRSVHTGRVIKY